GRHSGNDDFARSVGQARALIAYPVDAPWGRSPAVSVASSGAEYSDEARASLRSARATRYTLNAAALSPSPCLSPWAVPCLWQLLRLPQGGRHREGAQLAVEVTARVALAARPAAVHRVVHPEAARGAPGSGAEVHRVVHPEAARLSAREDVPAPGVGPAAQEVAHPADLAARLSAL